MILTVRISLQCTVYLTLQLMLSINQLHVSSPKHHKTSCDTNNQIATLTCTPNQLPDGATYFSPAQEKTTLPSHHYLHLLQL